MSSSNIFCRWRLTKIKDLCVINGNRGMNLLDPGHKCRLAGEPAPKVARAVLMAETYSPCLLTNHCISLNWAAWNKCKRRPPLNKLELKPSTTILYTTPRWHHLSITQYSVIPSSLSHLPISDSFGNLEQWERSWTPWIQIVHLNVSDDISAEIRCFSE